MAEAPSHYGPPVVCSPSARANLRFDLSVPPFSVERAQGTVLGRRGPDRPYEKTALAVGVIGHSEEALHSAQRAVRHLRGLDFPLDPQVLQ